MVNNQPMVNTSTTNFGETFGTAPELQSFHLGRAWPGRLRWISASDLGVQDVVLPVLAMSPWLSMPSSVPVARLSAGEWPMLCWRMAWNSEPAAQFGTAGIVVSTGTNKTRIGIFAVESIPPSQCSDTQIGKVDQYSHVTWSIYSTMVGVW